jgi:hypothetical protein
LGLEAGYNLELGFEIRKKFEIKQINYSNEEYITFNTSINSIILFFDNRFIIADDFKTINYGVKLNFDFFKGFLPILISLNKIEIFYDNKKNSYSFISLGTKYYIPY